MSTNTSGDMGLIKPELTDKIQQTISDLSYNFDEIDQVVSGKPDNASEVPYDNSISGLVAIDVQDAIDELDSDVDGLTTSKLSNIVEDTTPELGGELDSGEHSIGFTEKTNVSSTGTVTIDWKNSNKQVITLTENTTFNFTNPTNPCSLLLRIVQNANGGWTVTLPTIKWSEGVTPEFSLDADSIDILSLYFDGVNYYGMASIGFV